MERKILFVAKVDSHIANFHLPYMKWFKEQGFIVDIASSPHEKSKDIIYCDTKYNVPFSRNPLSLDNFRAYKQLKKIINDNDYDIIHLHTPIASFIGRLITRKRKKTKVLYTAHGFHFFQGSSKKSWIVYYTIEKFLSKFTDGIITINQEDYELAKTRFFKKCEVFYTPGVGVNLSNFKRLTEFNKTEYRKKLNLNDDDFIITYVAEINKNKNQLFLLDCVEEIRKQYPNIKLLLIGTGELNEVIDETIISNDLTNTVYRLGYRSDINEILNISDLVVSTSQREGLPKSIMESMAVGNPLLVSNVRGNRDLVIDNINGLVFKKNDKNNFIEKFSVLYNNPTLREKYGENSLDLVKKYSLENVLKEMIKIYNIYI